MGTCGGADPDQALSLRHTDLLGPLVKAIQEQQGMIEAQQAEIAALQARLAALEAKAG